MAYLNVGKMYVAVLARRKAYETDRTTTNHRIIVVADDANGASDRFRWAIMAKKQKKHNEYRLVLNALMIMFMRFVFMIWPTAVSRQQKRILYN